MMKRPFLAIAGFALGITASIPASATPESVIHIREEPFGLNETHLFVLRSSVDNLGTYENLRSEIFLVAIDAETGEEQHWVIDRSTRTGEYSEDGERLGFRVTRDPEIDDANPFAILASHSAVPWSAVSFAGFYEIPVKFFRSDDDTEWRASYPNGQLFRLTDTALAEHLKDLSTFMARNVADHPRFTSITTRELFADREVPLSTCEPVAVFGHYAFRTPGEELLVRVDCSDRDELGVTSAVITMAEFFEEERAE